jgi:hypothetical protein
MSTGTLFSLSPLTCGAKILKLVLVLDLELVSIAENLALEPKVHDFIHHLHKQKRNFDSYKD